MATTRDLRVFRFQKGDAEPRFDTFADVPVESRTSVLDALRWVQRKVDPTLSLRHSCYHASCGTCGLRVNGREVLACATRLSEVEDGAITVEPIANLPVLTDLVVDMSGFFGSFGGDHPLLRASDTVPGATPPSGIGDYLRYEDCIECGLCLSACPVVVTAGAYVGPAALAWVEREVAEPRGAEVADLLSWADDPDGVWRCHAIFECTAACPADVFPAQRIMSLRGSLIDAGGDAR